MPPEPSRYPFIYDGKCFTVEWSLMTQLQNALIVGVRIMLNQQFYTSSSIPRYLVEWSAAAAIVFAACVTAPLDARAAERCAFELNVKSSGAGSGVSKRSVRFVNNSQHTRQVYWLDYDGKRSKSAGGDIASRETLPIDTYVGHWFVITNSNDNCISVHGIGSDTRSISIDR
jgi:hypothetical protein